MEVDKEKEKQVSNETTTKGNEEKMESYNKMDIISTTSSQTSVTPISTKILWELVLFKPVFELQEVLVIIPSLTNYYFNTQTKSVFRRTKKKKHDTLETVSELSRQAQGDIKKSSIILSRFRSFC